MGLNRLKILAALFFLIFLLNGCYGVSTDTSDRILRPENNSIPLQGTWKVTECYASNNHIKPSLVATSKWIGVVAGFSGNMMTFGEEHWEYVNYKVKVVDAEEYFLHKFPDAIKRFGIVDEQVDVITASSENKFLYEFVKVSENRIIASIDDNYFSLEKISESYKVAKGGEGLKQSDTMAANSLGSSAVLKSGLLLGLRTQKAADSKSGLVEYNYSTYWISNVDNVLRPVLSTSDIFLPRKDGFWKLQVINYSTDGTMGDFLYASTVSTDVKKTSLLENSVSILNGMPAIDSMTHRTILYVGNDYVCVENSAYKKEQEGVQKLVYKALRTLPVDNVSNAAGIKISDLVGGNGSVVFKSAIDNVLKVSNTNGLVKAEDDRQEENFALYRKTGHWFFKGRLNVTGNNQVPFIDFNINLIPPLNMVAYDALQVPWPTIKDSIPKALDAYTSPKKDLAVILTRTEILLYRLNGGKLSSDPLEKLKISDGTSVIMAEWATGEYVEIWERAFIKNNVVKTLEPLQ